MLYLQLGVQVLPLTMIYLGKYIISAYGFGNELSFRAVKLMKFITTPNLYPFLRDAYEQRRNEQQWRLMKNIFNLDFIFNLALQLR